MKRNIFLILMPGLILAAGIQAAVYLSGHYSISSDESARTLIAYRWYDNKIIPAEVWLPLHSIILGYSFEINKDLIATPRAVSLLFGILSIGALAFLTDSLFKKKIITAGAVLLYIFLPERIILTAVPLPEIIYIFFILSGSVFLIKWLDNKKGPELLSASIFWMTAGALRYEGWIFSLALFIFCCIEFYKKNLSLKFFLTAASILAAFPIFWLIINRIENGNAFAFLSTTSGMFSSKYGGSIIKTAYLNVFWQFFEQNYNSYNFIGLFGMILIISRKNISRWIIVCFSGIILMGLISSFGKALPSHNFWRVSAVWTILLLPFTSYLLYELSGYILLKKPVKIILSSFIPIILITQFSVISLDRIKNMNSPYCLLKRDVAIGHSLDEILIDPPEPTVYRENSPGIILIEKNRFFDHLNISVALKNPGNVIYFEKRGSNLPRCGPEIIENNLDISYIKNSRIKYLLFKSPEEKKYLSSQKNVKALRKFDDWILYKII